MLNMYFSKIKKNYNYGQYLILITTMLVSYGVQAQVSICPHGQRAEVYRVEISGHDHEDIYFTPNLPTMYQTAATICVNKYSPVQNICSNSDLVNCIIDKFNNEIRNNTTLDRNYEWHVVKSKWCSENPDQHTVALGIKFTHPSHAAYDRAFPQVYFNCKRIIDTN